MIQERHMKQAKRLDNEEQIDGCYLILEDGHYIVAITTDGSRIFKVDPATVEDVAVKPIREKTLVGDYRCPNCNAAFIEAAGITPYCGNCGQRLAWE